MTTPQQNPAAGSHGVRTHTLNTVHDLTTGTPVGLTLQHQQALAIAAWGLEVHPLNGKKPRLEKWPEKTTANPNQIDQWWGWWPTANIGCQPPAWAVVIDVDPHNGGHDTWQQITGTYEFPTDTFVTRTGSGGAHVWYRLPYAGELRGKIDPGIDIQPKGKQLVMPGSIHPKTGKLYEVRTWYPPAQWAVLPHCWRKHVYKPTTPPQIRRPINIRRQGGGAGLIRFLAGAEPGDRNHALYWTACRALENGLDIENELEQTAISIGLTPNETRNSLNSARNTYQRGALGEVS